MFEQMMNLVKGEVAKRVGGMDAIPAEKRSEVVSTATSSLMSGLKQYASPDNLSSLLGIGGAKGGAGMTSSLSSGVVSSLTSKTGLSSGVAQSIASSIVPAVMSLLKKNASGSGQSGFNLQSMASALTGGAGSAAGGLGGKLQGMLGGLGSLFGKK